MVPPADNSEGKATRAGGDQLKDGAGAAGHRRRSSDVGGPHETIRLVSEGHSVPFSKSLLATTLTATGMQPEDAFAVAMDVERELLEASEYEVSVGRLRLLVEEVLEMSARPLYIERYRKWNRLGRDDRPVIILIGGATGVGKSTMAAQLADRLGLVRIISTDSIREVMRAFFSESLMPSIHYSSYDADRAVRMPLESGLDFHLVGFMEQVEMVNVGVQAVIDRAVKERTSLVVEGVHVVPGMLTAGRNKGQGQDALVLPVVVAVRDPELHRSHFLVREQETAGRRLVARNLEGFDEIRRIQDFILDQADAEGTLVVDNLSIDDAVGMMVEALYELIEKSEGRACGDE